MSEKDQPYVQNEGAHTGPVRMEIYGPLEVGSLFGHIARAQLGQMLSDYGINDLAARGETTGVVSRNATRNGARIQTIHNNGQNTIRIYVTGEGGAPQDDAEVLASFDPYFWVGARIVSGGEDVVGSTSYPADYELGRFVKLHLAVWMDAEIDETTGVESGKDGFDILSNRNRLLAEEGGYSTLFGFSSTRNASYYPLGDNSIFPSSEDYADHPNASTARGGLIAYTKAQGALCIDGQYPDVHYDLENLGIDADTFEAGLYAPDDASKETRYDVAVICDPKDRCAYNDIADKGDVDPDWATGKPTRSYSVTLMAVASDCINFQPVTVELLVYVGEPGGEYSRVDTVQIEISEFTKKWHGILPYGIFNPDRNTPAQECSGEGDYGPNPHGPHWWLGTVEAVCPAQQQGVPIKSLDYPVLDISNEGEARRPDTGFVEGTFSSRDDRCRYCQAEGWKIIGLGASGTAYTPSGGLYQPGLGLTYGYHDVQGFIGFDVVLTHAGPGGDISTGFNILAQAYEQTTVPLTDDPNNPAGTPPSWGAVAPDISVPTVGVFASPLADYQTSDPGPSYGDVEWEVWAKLGYSWDENGHFTATFMGWLPPLVAGTYTEDDMHYTTSHQVPYPYDAFNGLGERIAKYAKEWRFFPNSYSDTAGYGWPDPAEPTPPDGT